MHNQRGFVGVGVLIAILVGLAVLGGGAYYVMQQQAPTQTASDNFENAQQLPTTNNQQTQTTTNTPAPTQQATQSAPITYTSANLTASPMSGAAPLAVNFSGRIEVPNNQRGAAVMFFGDGVSDVMDRKGPTLFNEGWSHTYTKAGEYDAVLAITTESNVDADIQVMKNPNYYKNVVVKKIRISVGSAVQTITPGSSQIAIIGTYNVNGMIGIAKFVPDKPSEIESIGFTNSVEANSMFHQHFVSVGDNCSTQTRAMVRVTGLSKNTTTSNFSPSHTATLVALGSYSGPGETGDLIEVICGEALSPAEAAAKVPGAGQVAILLYRDDEAKRKCYGESGICSMQYDVKTKVIPSVSRIADAMLKQLFTEYFPELSSAYSDVSIVDGVAYVNFKKDGEKYLDAPPGTSGMYMHSIKKTLLQFNTIKDVRYKIGGVVKTGFDA